MVVFGKNGILDDISRRRMVKAGGNIAIIVFNAVGFFCSMRFWNWGCSFQRVEI